MVKQKRIQVIIVYALGVGITPGCPNRVQSLVNSVSFGTLLQPIVVFICNCWWCTYLIRSYQTVATLCGRVYSKKISCSNRLVFIKKTSTCYLQRFLQKLWTVDQVPRFMEVFTVQSSFNNST